MGDEKHAIAMVGVTAAAMAAAFGINLLVRHRARKRLVNSVSLGENKGLEFEYCEPGESSIIVSETFQDDQEDTCSIVSEPPSEAPSSTGTADRNYEIMEENLAEFREKEKAKKKEKFERMFSCVKELEERVMKLSLQEAEITELKQRVKVDEEKIDQLNLQEVEIIELKKKIKNDEHQLQQLQQEVAMLRDVKNKKKNWWNKDTSVHDASASVNGSRKNKL